MSLVFLVRFRSSAEEDVQCPAQNLLYRSKTGDRPPVGIPRLVSAGVYLLSRQGSARNEYEHEYTRRRRQRTYLVSYMYYLRTSARPPTAFRPAIELSHWSRHELICIVSPFLSALPPDNNNKQ